MIRTPFEFYGFDAQGYLKNVAKEQNKLKQRENGWFCHFCDKLIIREFIENKGLIHNPPSGITRDNFSIACASEICQNLLMLRYS